MCIIYIRYNKEDEYKQNDHIILLNNFLIRII